MMSHSQFCRLGGSRFDWRRVRVSAIRSMTDSMLDVKIIPTDSDEMTAARQRERINSIVLVFEENFSMAEGDIIKLQIQREGQQLVAKSTIPVHVVPTTIPVPAHVMQLASNLHSPGGLSGQGSPGGASGQAARIKRAYRLGQIYHTLPLGEGGTSLPANDQSPNLPHTCWLIFKSEGKVTSTPSYHDNRKAKDEHVQKASGGVLVIGFASQAEARACSMGAGFPWCDDTRNVAVSTA